ncbi:MAG: hypothetical protein ABH864_03185 [archaeon]
MKTNNLIPVVIVVGLLVLFFFPNPESNFLGYFGVMLVFVLIIAFLLIKNKKK